MTPRWPLPDRLPFRLPLRPPWPEGERAPPDLRPRRHSTRGGLWLAWALLLGLVLAVAQADVHARPAAGAPPAQAPGCVDCGVVVAVTRIEEAGEATGLGAVMGGALGGLIGREMSRREHRGPPLAVIGAIGGGVIGHRIEKHLRRRVVYDIDVRMPDGRILAYTQDRALQVGQTVRVTREGAWPISPPGTRPDHRHEGGPNPGPARLPDAV